MNSQIRVPLSQKVQDLLCCPICHAKLKQATEQYECTNYECAAHFPIVDGIPVLLNERSSVFSIKDCISNHTRTSRKSSNKLKKTIRGWTRNIGMSIKSEANYAQVSEVLLKQSSAPQVLVIGGSILGQGMDSLTNSAAIDLVETDVIFGPRTRLICDAHDIPFEDQSFDGVIIQAVLEHVVDPYRCCEEIHRVLKDRGVVYAETPFIQQVHGRYDFTRFTYLGHRRLFRRFEEIDSGAACGPGMALAWSYQYFLMSFTTSRKLRVALALFASLTSFYLKYFDYYLINKPGALDAASGYYFIGRKTEQTLSDHELMKLYKGLELSIHC